jgi:UDP-3-O-[3-hydroxymyristoyl] glucosamine N-acyltransferase
MRKYSISNQTCELSDGRILYRVIANRDFGNVKKGTVGGFIGDTQNLSQEGDCWIADDAAVYDTARGSANAWIGGTATVKGGAIITEFASVFDDALIEEYVYIGGHAQIKGDTYINGEASVRGNVVANCVAFRSNSGKTLMPNISGRARLNGTVFLYDRIAIRDTATVDGINVVIRNHAKIIENAGVFDNAVIEGHAVLSGDARVFQHGIIRDRAKVTNDALVCGYSQVGGKSLVTGRACITGTACFHDQTFSGDQYVTTRNGLLHISTY